MNVNRDALERTIAMLGASERCSALRIGDAKRTVRVLVQPLRQLPHANFQETLEAVASTVPERKWLALNDLVGVATSARYL